MSRLTFRNKAGDIAWQKQLRDSFADEGVPNVPHLDLSRSVVRPVGRDFAKTIILKYEWLGTMAPTSRHYGIFFGSYCAGVTCVGGTACTAGNNTHKEFGLHRRELAILARGANTHWSPKGANSKLVSWTCRLLARESSYQLMLAYSDTDAGEYGTIYQACNWVCIGRGRARKHGQIVSPKGRIYDIRNVDIWAKKRHFTWRQQLDALLSAGYRLQDANPKYRYVYVLNKSNKSLANLIESMQQPYPKREHHAGG